MNALLDRVVDHAESVKVDPSTRLDKDLFEELSRESVLDSLSSNAKLRLISSLAPLIPTLQQDPTPAARLLTALLRSDGLPPFSQVLEMEPETDILAGLQSPLESLNLLTISLLSRVETPADVWLLAGKREIVYALVKLWLTTPHTAVAEQSQTVLKDMLRIDGPFEDEGSLSSRDDSSSQSFVSKPSSGLIWRRIFKDKDIYSLIFASCSLKSSVPSEMRTKSTVTIAQARLLSLLSSILHAPQIWESQLPEVEGKFDVSSGGGILEFAMLRMVDYEDDLLMHMHLIEFFGELIRSHAGIAFGVPTKLHQETGVDSSIALDVLISTGLHERTASLYLDPRADDLFADYLYGPAGQYIESYAQSHTGHFRKYMAERVISKTSTTLENISRSAWAHQRAPIHEIRMIASIPRQTILSFGQGSVVMHLPVAPANEVVLSALAHIFDGSVDEDTKSHPTDQDFVVLEQASARALFFLYLSQNPTFWAEVVRAASVTASVETATAAVRLIKAIVNSSWAKLPSDGIAGILTEDDLKAKCPSYPHLPHKGALLVMTEPALPRVLQFLLKGPENSSSNAYTIAREKHDIIPILRKRLEEATEDVEEGQTPDAWKEMLMLLRHRESLGPAGGDEQSIRVPNPEVGTMEM